MLKCCRLCTLAGGNFRWGKTESVIDFFGGPKSRENCFFGSILATLGTKSLGNYITFAFVFFSSA